jgi:hypothetical protein
MNYEFLITHRRVSFEGRGLRGGVKRFQENRVTLSTTKPVGGVESFVD